MPTWHNKPTRYVERGWLCSENVETHGCCSRMSRFQALRNPGLGVGSCCANAEAALAPHRKKHRPS